MSTRILAQVVRDAVRNQQYQNAFTALNELQPVDVADILSQLTPAQAWALLKMLPEAAEVFAYFDAEQQVRMAEQAPRGGLAPLVGAMAADERADLFNRLDETQPALLLPALAQAERAGMLPALAQAEREDMRKLASYQEGTAGALMTSDYATLKPTMTVQEALVALRQEAPDAETIYHAFVTDDHRRLVGAVSLRELILAKPHLKVEELMEHSVIHAHAQTEQKEEARLSTRCG